MGKRYIRLEKDNFKKQDERNKSVTIHILCFHYSVYLSRNVPYFNSYDILNLHLFARLLRENIVIPMPKIPFFSQGICSPVNISHIYGEFPLQPSSYFLCTLIISPKSKSFVPDQLFILLT